MPNSEPAKIYNVVVVHFVWESSAPLLVLNLETSAPTPCEQDALPLSVIWNDGTE